MIGVVLDTNVVVSAHLKDEGLEAAVLDLVFRYQLTLYVSKPILDEYEQVLLRPKLRIAPERVQYALAQIRAIGTLIAPTRTLSASPHEPDNRLLECAEAAQADYLVTGNKRHFPKRWKTTQIVNARELTELLTLELLP
jgi:putative PIN family toxin of toxin-antitoxin system